MAGNPATGAPISQFDETKYIAFRVYQLGPYEWQRLYWHGTGYPGIKIGITAELTTGVSLGNPLGEKCIYFAKVTPASLHHSPQKKKKTELCVPTARRSETSRSIPLRSHCILLWL